MKIVTLFKVVPDDQDLRAAPDGSLDVSQAKPAASSFDLSAIEAAAQLADATPGAELIALTAGPPSANDSKLTKSILARGPQALHRVIDPALEDADTHVTARVLAAALRELGADLIVAGDGSADVYAQQTGIQVAELLGLPVLNAVSAITLGDGAVTVERTLETETERVEIPLPAVVCVTSDAAVPRIPGMKEILAAGKRLVIDHDLGGLGVTAGPSVDIVATTVPPPADRGHQIFDVANDGDVDRFAAALAAALQ